MAKGKMMKKMGKKLIKGGAKMMDKGAMKGAKDDGKMARMKRLEGKDL